METMLNRRSTSSSKHSPSSSIGSVKDLRGMAVKTPNRLASSGSSSSTMPSLRKKVDASPPPPLESRGSTDSSSGNAASTLLRRRSSSSNAAALVVKPPAVATKQEGNGSVVVTKKAPEERSDEDSPKNPSTAVKLAPSNSSARKSPLAGESSSGGSSGGTQRRLTSSVSSAPRLSSTTSVLKAKPLSSTTASSRSSRDSRFMMLPQVDKKASDELRLDSRGQRVRSLKTLNLSENLEFVYLRDNNLSSLHGIEFLKRVKVLDLSFNDFKSLEFEPLAELRALQQLYLAGNQITSLTSLPELPNLEFLSIAQNKLSSLSMASQPRLQVLAASKNKIETLKGFPCLPSLEHLRVEENPIMEMPHLESASILLVGHSLKKFNDRDLPPSEVKLAKRYPAETAFCLREGWKFCRQELAADSIKSFLAEKWKDQLPPGFEVKEACVDRPSEEDVCRCHFSFTSTSSNSELVLKYRWFVGDRIPVNFVPVTDVSGEVYWPKHEDIGRHLKVECTPSLNGTEYPPIFAISPPVSSGTKIPKVISLKLKGDLVEGNIIRGIPEIAWCGGMPGKGVASWLRRSWHGSLVAIGGAEDEEYLLTLDDVASSLVFMYAPVTIEGIKGEPQYAISDFIKAAPPSVSKVQVVGDAVEGNVIKGAGEYFGGREGPSKYEWLREKDNGEFVLVSRGTTEHTLTKDDIGRRLKFVYLPINLEGHEGESASALTETVRKAPPRVTDLKIIGEMRESSKLTVAAVVTGGNEGSSRVQWFKTTSFKFNDEHCLEALGTPKVAKAFCVPLEVVGYYIVAKFIPVALDGEVGEPAYAISETVVETLPPSLNFLTLTGEFCEGALLTASYSYIGGHEGGSQYSWHVHDDGESDYGTPILEASGLIQYHVGKAVIGKYISFKCTPVRDDGLIGEENVFLSKEPVRPGNPTVVALQIAGKAIEGTTLVANKKYWGGEEGNSIYRWFLTNADGVSNEISGMTGSSSYVLSRTDIGFLVSVSCEPVRSDGVHGPVVISNSIGPILPGPPTCKSLDLLGNMAEGGRLSFLADYCGGEKGSCIHEWFRVKKDGTREELMNDEEFLDLTLEDVQSCIELQFTPVRSDRMKGVPKSVISDLILPADPKGIELVIPNCCQDEDIVPLKTYYGGNEGNGTYKWYRTIEKLCEADQHNITSSDLDIVAETYVYKPSLEDVGSYLILHWMPTRDDGKAGEPLIAISNHPVCAALPAVSEVHVKVEQSGIFVGEGLYYGGHEGSSLFRWYRENEEGTFIPIDNADSTTYKAVDEDYTFRLRFGYTPIRSDGVAGEEVLSEPSDIVFPELPRIDMLSLKGQEIEGEMLRVVEVIPDSEIQQHVWDKYKKEISYQWFSSTVPEECSSFVALAAETSASYKVRFEDIGRCIKCECVVTDSFGRSGGTSSIITGPISPGFPKISGLEIEGRGFHTNLYAIRGTYTGGKEGKSKVQWLRSMVGSPDLISIPGEVGRTYEANVDDVGYRLVAIYTPIRDDGVEGQPVSASTDPIAVELDIFRDVKQKMDLGSVKFEVLCNKDKSPKKVQGTGSLERRILEVNGKKMKVVRPGSKTSFATTEVRGTYAPPFHVELFRNDQHRFKIVVDGESEVELMVQTRHMRDLVVLVLRGFAQKFNSTSLNSLLKIET